MFTNNSIVKVKGGDQITFSLLDKIPFKPDIILLLFPTVLDENFRNYSPHLACIAVYITSLFVNIYIRAWINTIIYCRRIF